MSEVDRNPAIRIHIDQQVFIDAVLGNEEIEDATVVTEVVGFDRNETSYLLDGALVFSGYIRQEERELEITAEDLQGDIGSALQEDEMTVQQIHCRMPFTLEVPVAAQRNEFINVVPRVGTWNLSTLGPKWVHVRAELIVNGLIGEEGYRFRCGTQEEGIPESQALAFAEGYRSAEEYAAQVQEPMSAEARQTFDAQQVSPFDSQSLQFPFSPLWQKGMEGAERALDGAYPFSAPFTKPFVSSKQPPSWDRHWPEPIGSRSTADAAEAADTIEAVQNEEDAFESSVQAYRGYEPLDQAGLEGDTELAKQTESVDQIPQETVAASASTTGQGDELIAAEQIDGSIENQDERTFETSFRQSEHVQQTEEEVGLVGNQPERDDAVEEQDTLDVVTVNVDTDSASLEPILQEAAEPQSHTTFHFEEVAESSTLHQEPKFQLKIQGKVQKESSTFGAMSTLMEAAQADREESTTAASLNEEKRESSSRVSQLFESKTSSAQLSFSDSSTVAEQQESASGSTEDIRESSSHVSKDSPSITVVATEQPAEPAMVVEQVVEVVETPAMVEEVLEVTQPVPTVVEQERPLELVVESGTEVDVMATEEQGAAAAVTIAERKQQESDSNRVYLWTELYPFLEETFQSIKFRIVQDEDSVDRIAEAYRITTMDLMRANHMQTEQLDVGQLLYIPTRKR